MVAAFANAAARRMVPSDIGDIVKQEDRQDAGRLIEALGRRFLAAPLSEKHRQILRDYLEPRTDLTDADIRHAIRLLMSTPEYQVT
jgi:hypothetical protein